MPLILRPVFNEQSRDEIEQHLMVVRARRMSAVAVYYAGVQEAAPEAVGAIREVNHPRMVSMPPVSSAAGPGVSIGAVSCNSGAEAEGLAAADESRGRHAIDDRGLIRSGRAGSSGDGCPRGRRRRPAKSRLQSAERQRASPNLQCHHRTAPQAHHMEGRCGGCNGTGFLVRRLRAAGNGPLQEVPSAAAQPRI
jgi:hypothetical protein